MFILGRGQGWPPFLLGAQALTNHKKVFILFPLALTFSFPLPLETGQGLGNKRNLFYCNTQGHASMRVRPHPTPLFMNLKALDPSLDISMSKAYLLISS